jgi:hypothetical protein
MRRCGDVVRRLCSEPSRIRRWLLLRFALVQPNILPAPTVARAPKRLSSRTTGRYNRANPEIVK